MAAFLPGDPSHHGMYENGSYKFTQDKPDEGGSWYLSRKEIEENSPFKKDGIDLKKEAYLRKSYCTFLQDLGMRLKVHQVTIATAITFCHRFFLRQSYASNDRRVPFQLEGPYGVLRHLEHLIKDKGSAVVCVAEGAGQDLLKKSNLTDASGNVILGDISVHVQHQIKKHFKEIGVPADVKYIDPTYMIRAYRANASDAILCTVLGQNAVHGAFAGYSGISVGICNNHYVYLPIPEVITSPRCVCCCCCKFVCCFRKCSYILCKNHGLLAADEESVMGGFL